MADNGQWTTVSHRKVKPAKAKDNGPIDPLPQTVIQPVVAQRPSNFEDAQTVVFRKDTKPVTIKLDKSTAPNSSKTLNVSQYQRKLERAIDNDEPIPKKQYTEDFRQRITKAKLSLNLNSAQLAQRLSVKERDIRDIENKSANYDPALMLKISNGLTQLERAHKRAIQSQAQKPVPAQ